MRRACSIFAAATLLAATAISTPAKADPWWFLTGMVVGAVVAPAYGYPYGYRSVYAPVRATAPWAGSLEPPPQCEWAKVEQNGAWRHARICYEAAPAGAVRHSETIIRK
jgi:hypothetical protein